MANKKEIEIIVDRSSWNPKIVPPEINRLVGKRATDPDLALIHTALWTRPPTYKGFDLSDSWAWLRYQRAISSSPDLRLRKEWKDIDFHQKNILTDELGVGFTTQLCAEGLGYLYFAETKYIVDLLGPKYLGFKKGKKRRGPTKSPDYLGLDSNGKLNILECKGSQSSRKTLNQAIQRGIPQKKNLSLAGTSRFNHCLVAGLFIPQHRNHETSLIQICDPEPNQLRSLLGEVPDEDLAIAVVRVALAKHFALMGAYQLSNSLMSQDDSANPFTNIAPNEIPLLDNDKETLAYSVSRPLPPMREDSNDIWSRARQVTFSMNYPVSNFEELRSNNRLDERLYTLANNSEDHHWSSHESETSAALFSPLGFELRLDYRL